MQVRKIQLLSYFYEDVLAKENLRKKFIGCMLYLIKNINDSENIMELFYKMINCDSSFDSGLVSYFKESCINFIEASD